MFRRLVTWTFLCLAAAALHAETPPVEYATFMSHGKAVSCVVYDPHNALATMIVLRGSGPSDLNVGRLSRGSLPSTVFVFCWRTI